MVKIKIKKNAAEIIDIVLNVRSQGWIQGIDFDFEYYPPTEPDYEKYAVFTFYTEKYASWFALRWS